ncbi:hypothetical protein FH972_024360 [Carpinus fangiana]|uniref:Cellulase n=1 Tax=Carpinus fangiana TaxID=176857 RepID=A0A5N6KYB2_9ROSI|nr:hypothetical protein FH972_024360 [Carpinus fangiana]
MALVGAMFTTLSTLLLASIVTAGPATFPSFPLAVRSPYLSTWLPHNLASNAPEASPQFWMGQTLTWPVLAQVDGKNYALFGGSSATYNQFTGATQQSLSYTSTHTYISLAAGNAQFVLDFFSPVSTGNFLRQSLPYSYLTVSVIGKPGYSPNVKILSAVDSSWTNQPSGVLSNYSIFQNSGVFDLHNPNEIPFTETNDGQSMASYGHIVFAAKPGTVSASKLTAQCGQPQALTTSFAMKGKLDNTYTAPGISSRCGHGSLNGFSFDIGNVSKNVSVTYAVGYDTPQAINHLGSIQTGYYYSKYKSIPEVANAFLGDYASALAESQTLDSVVRARGSSISSKYGDILEATVRQVFAAMVLTIPQATLDTSNPWAFQKEISTGGKVNTIDVIYPTMPILYVLAPQYIKLLLKPVLAVLATGKWLQPWMIHDISNAYPNVTGHGSGFGADAEEHMPITASAMFLTLTHAYQQATKDRTWPSPSDITLLQKYANYLIDTGIYFSPQLDTTDAIPASGNQTNLALHSVIGLSAFGKVTGNATYTQTAQKFATQLYTSGVALSKNRSHFTYNYGVDASWGVTPELFTDLFLGLNNFPVAARTMQCEWYARVVRPAGLQYASGLTNNCGAPGCSLAITDWSDFALATCSKEIQTKLLDIQYSFLTNGLNPVPFPTRYFTDGAMVGQWNFCRARPTIGSSWALSALKDGTWSSAKSGGLLAQQGA